MQLPSKCSQLQYTSDILEHLFKSTAKRRSSECSYFRYTYKRVSPLMHSHIGYICLFFLPMCAYIYAQSIKYLSHFSLILDQFSTNALHNLRQIISQFDTKYFAIWNKYISPFWTNTFVNRRQIHFAIPDKYTSQFETNSFTIWYKVFCNLEQIHFAILNKYICQ